MVAGAIADRSDRKRMMFLADLGRAGLTALIPLSVALGGPTMAVILIVAAPMSILRSFFLAGYTASVPALVGRSQVGRANSYFEAIYSIGYILGPAIAGVLAATIGPGPTLAIDAVSFALSALGLLFVRRDLRAPIDRPAAAAADRDPRGHRLHRSPIRPLRTIILFWGAISILLAPLVTALAVHVTRTSATRAVVLGSASSRPTASGPSLGSLLTARLDRAQPRRRDAARWQLGDGPRADRSSQSRSASRSCSGPRSSPAIAQSMVLVTYITLRTAYLARRPARTDREHGADDLARPPADRPARRRRADRPDQRVRSRSR